MTTTPGGRPRGVPTDFPGQSLDGLLSAYCWCETSRVRLTTAEVRRGVTQSCGADDCGPNDIPNDIPDVIPPPPADTQPELTAMIERIQAKTLRRKTVPA